MMGPSDLYRVPACLSPAQSEDALRYARLEHDADSLAWTLPATTPTPSRTSLRQWLTSLFGRTRAAAPLAHPTLLRAGIAAVHFEGEASERVRAFRSTDPGCDRLASAALVLAVPTHEPAADDVCTCEH